MESGGLKDDWEEIIFSLCDSISCVHQGHTAHALEQIIIKFSYIFWLLNYLIYEQMFFYQKHGEMDE